jgi:hypothetical protein
MYPLGLPRDNLLERITAMMHQEEVSYRYDKYWCSALETNAGAQLNVAWREKICQWSYNVVDHFDLPREMVAISLDLFDRYMATIGNQCSGNMALLVSLTTLHIAIKIHSEKRIKISTLASLSRGQFTAEDIEEMEWQILSAVAWKLHPPTLLAFISHFLMLLPNEAHHSVRKELFELSIYMAELSVCDSYFVRIKASVVSFAAILNVIEEMPYSRLSAEVRESFLRDLAYYCGLNPRSALVESARERLQAMFVPVVSACEDIDMVDCTKSPCSTVVEATESLSTIGSSATTTSSKHNVFRGSSALVSNVEGKGTLRYTASSRRRCVVAASPLASSRSRTSNSQTVAGIQ